MTSKTRQIRIDFPCDVEIGREAHRVIVHGVDMICTAWERENPGQIMWPAGVGALMLSHPMRVDDDHPMEFDMSVEHIDVASREGYPKELARRVKKQNVELSAHEQLCRELFNAFGRSFDDPVAPVWSRVASRVLTLAAALHDGEAA